MYNKYLEVRPCSIGKGLFTTMQIPAGVPITEFRGNIVVFKDLPEDSSMYLQVGPDTFLSPIGTAEGADFINHSCDPNCNVHVVGNRAVLYSLYVIPAGAQLTFDYSTTSTDTLDMWKMNCNCGSPKCRRVISGHQYLDPNLKANYEKRGMLPIYVTMPNLIQKRW